MNMHYLLKAALLSVALSGPATAAVYTGIWDPPIGATPFTADLGWRGEATFSVPDSCVLAGDGTVTNGSCGGTAVVTSASVELYDTDAPAGLLATLVFNPASITIFTLHYLSGELDQLESSLSSVLALDVDLSTYNAPSATTFALSFTLEGPRLHFNCTGVASTSCSGINNNGLGFRPDFVITRVPEPASLALSGLALAGLAALRRRRAQPAA